MCFVFFWETAIVQHKLIGLYNRMKGVYRAVRIGSLNKGIFLSSLIHERWRNYDLTKAWHLLAMQRDTLTTEIRTVTNLRCSLTQYVLQCCDSCCMACEVCMCRCVGVTGRCRCVGVRFRCRCVGVRCRCRCRTHPVRLSCSRTPLWRIVWFDILSHFLPLICIVLS
jgi:hypothetical protein